MLLRFSELHKLTNRPHTGYGHRLNIFPLQAHKPFAVNTYLFSESIIQRLLQVEAVKFPLLRIWDLKGISVMVQGLRLSVVISIAVLIAGMYHCS